MLVLFVLFVFFVWIFSWRDLFQLTGTDATCVLYIICSPLSKSRSILPIAPGLLHCCHHLMLFCVALTLICFLLNLIVRFTSEFSLSCTDLCKVSTENSHFMTDHVFSQMVVLIARIEDNCFYVIFSILLVWRMSDLFNVSLQITGYVSLHNHMPLHITLSKLLCFYYIIICPVSPAYTIGVVSFP